MNAIETLRDRIDWRSGARENRGEMRSALADVEALLEAAKEVVRIESTGTLPDFIPLAAAVARVEAAR